MSEKRPPAPGHLSPRSKGLWKAILAEYEFDTSELVLLRAGLEHLDLHDAAMAHVREYGPVVMPSNGGIPRANPAGNRLNL